MTNLPFRVGIKTEKPFWNWQSLNWATCRSYSKARTSLTHGLTEASTRGWLVSALITHSKAAHSETSWEPALSKLPLKLTLLGPNNKMTVSIMALRPSVAPNAGTHRDPLANPCVSVFVSFARTRKVARNVGCAQHFRFCFTSPGGGKFPCVSVFSTVLTETSSLPEVIKLHKFHLAMVRIAPQRSPESLRDISRTFRGANDFDASKLRGEGVALCWLCIL